MIIISIDPSGTGTTGFCIIKKNKNNESEFHFLDHKNNDWKKHILFIKKTIEKEKPDLIIYENTNYIHKKTKDGLSLFRMLGAIEFIAEEDKILEINVLKTKKIKKKLIAGEIKIERLKYLSGRGKGWIFENKRISKHCLDSYIIYHLWENEKMNINDH